MLRRFFAAVSPYGTTKSIGGGALWPRIRAGLASPGPSPGGRGRLRLAADVHPRGGRLRLVRPDRQPCHPPAGSARRRRRSRLVDSGGPSGTSRRTPAALRSWCRAESALHPGLPLWVVENGMASRGGAPRADGWDRPRYLREHLGAVVDAVEADVPVRGYLHWSLVDNYEWGTYEPRLGLFGTGPGPPRRRGALARTPTPRVTMRPAPSAASSTACSPATGRCSNRGTAELSLGRRAGARVGAGSRDRPGPSARARRPRPAPCAARGRTAPR